MNDSRLSQLKKKKGETAEEFVARFGLTNDEYQNWVSLTKDGTKYGSIVLE